MKNRSSFLLLPSIRFDSDRNLRKRKKRPEITVSEIKKRQKLSIENKRDNKRYMSFSQRKMMTPNLSPQKRPEFARKVKRGKKLKKFETIIDNYFWFF